ncbi:hypothetical protein [Dyadobacter sandarakinus]|uniref:Uncharacterized protein n=1 Tax=Dyadobacter sandarakinus TaxID=2747268 RepID=A0ABX7I2M4_9BACT|nr:hypothetical protein [Dyadobacter sandarakinus]QRR00332.1 hypothetical protein HWI92_05130 [Dyadobacter sandarakinus]
MMGYPVAFLLEEKSFSAVRSAEYIERSSFSKDIVVKVPVSLPYQNSWDAPEPSEGAMRHKQDYYQIRSQQLVNDTLYVYCEYDQNARDRYISLASHISEQAADTHRKLPSHLLKNFLKEFMSGSRRLVFLILEFPEKTATPADRYSSCFSSVYSDIPAPPPDAA